MIISLVFSVRIYSYIIAIPFALFNSSNYVAFNTGFKRSDDGTLLPATENGQKSLFDILEEIREEVELQNLDPDEDEEEIEAPPEGPSDENPHPLPAHHILKVIRAMVSLRNLSSHQTYRHL